jgi:tetraacyldisaccharide 4'-kinase
MLREPVAGLKRAHVVCMTRADQLDTADRAAIRRRVAQLAPQAAWCEAAHMPHELREVGGQTQPAATVAGRRVAAFCGIGNPAAFRRTLEGLGASVACWREFPDHHAYSSSDRAELSAAIASSGAELVVATHKDLVKLPVEQLGGRPFWSLVVEMRFMAAGEALEMALQQFLPRAAV